MHYLLSWVRFYRMKCQSFLIFIIRNRFNIWRNVSKYTSLERKVSWQVREQGVGRKQGAPCCSVLGKYRKLGALENKELADMVNTKIQINFDFFMRATRWSIVHIYDHNVNKEIIFYLVLWPDQPPGRDHRFRKEQDAIIISWHGHSFPIYFHWFCFILSARRALLADQ